MNKLYFISSDKNLTKLIPRVPSNFLTKNGYEDNTTPRVCMSTSINGALKALSSNLEGKELYVYTNDNKVDVYKPSIKEVPDCKLTDEVWIKKPVILKYLYKIKVTSDNKDGEVYTYGNNKATLYGWDYEVVNESTDQSTLDNNFKEKSKVPYKIVEFDRNTATKYLKDQFSPDALEFNIKSRAGEIIVNTKDDSLIGYVCIIKTGKKNLGIIGPLQVKKQYRGMGFGDILVKDAVNKYGGNQLGVYKDNEVAKKIYKKYGFKEIEDHNDWVKMVKESSMDEACISETNNDSVNNATKENIVNFTLPAIHAFERWSVPYTYQPVIGKVKILNPSGLEDKKSNINESFAENGFYFYHIIPKDANIDDGISTLQYQYDNNDIETFRKNAKKYREKLTGTWGVYRDREPWQLSDEEIVRGIRSFKKDADGANRIYLFLYPPFKELGPAMEKLLEDKDIYRINLDNEELKDIIKDIDWGHDQSGWKGGKLNRLYYEMTKDDKYFENYKEGGGRPPLSYLNSISIVPKDGIIPRKFWTKVKPINNIKYLKESNTIVDESYMNILRFCAESDIKLNIDQINEIRRNSNE